MPSTILEPPILGATRSPLLLRVNADRYRRAAGVKAQWRVTFVNIAGGAGPDPTGNIVITYGEEVVTMRVETTLSGDGNGFLPWIYGLNQAGFFAQGCRRNAVLSRDFVITQATNEVIFTARQPGARFNISSVAIDPSFDAAGHAEDTAGVDEVLEGNYSMRCAIYLEKNYETGLFERLPEISGKPDANLTVQFNLGPMLTPYLRTDRLPWSGYFQAIRCDQSQRRYHVEVWEQFGDPPDPHDIARVGAPYSTPATYKMAWLAAWRRQDYAAWETFVTGVANTNFSANTKRWLTWRGRTARHEVTMAEKHFLGFYHYFTRPNPDIAAFYGYIYLQARVHTLEGNATAWTPVLFDPPTNWKRLYSAMWPTGYDDLYLGDVLDIDLPGETPIRYDVRLLDPESNLVLSEVHTFHLVPPDHNEVHLLYLSSLGMWESLRCTGAHAATIDAAHQQTAGGVLYDSLIDPAGSMARAHPLGAQRALQLHTGWLAKGEFDVIREVLAAPEILLLDHESQRFLPVRLNGSREQRIGGKGGAQEHLHGLQLDLLCDDPEIAVTPLPIA